MPTLFARRYLRGKPKPTEKRVGLLVLALLSFLVGAFLLTGGLFAPAVENSKVLSRAKSIFGISERPLFAADPENLPAPTPARELRVAESLLPDGVVDGPGQGSGAVQAFVLFAQDDPDAAVEAGCDPEFVGSVQELNARWVYAREYGQEGSAVRVQIADLGDPQSALKAWEARNPEGSRPLTVGRGGWIGNGRAGFWAGRYYTELTGNGSSSGPSIEPIARAVAGMQLSYGGPFGQEAPTALAAEPQAEQTGDSGASAGVARFAEVPGGRILAPPRIERYAENMYEKINGKESAFRAFFVVDLKFGQYADPDSRETYDVYVYDMATPVNAMGMYMSERAPSPEFVEVGREGYVSGNSIFFWKGQYYVNVLGPTEGGEQALKNANAIATAIAETIADDGEPLWADKLLPSEDRVAKSLSYQATSALGYEFLQRLFFARYEVDGKKMQMFLSRAAGTEAAKDIFTRFAESTARYDKILARESLEGGELFVSETPMPGRPSKYGVGFHKGPYFGGVYDAQDSEVALTRAKVLFASLSADDPGDPDAAAISSAAEEQPAESGEESYGEESYGEESYQDSSGDEGSKETDSGY